MPRKTTDEGREYRVDGKARTFTWTTEDGEQVTLPLRVKMRTLRTLADRDANDASAMFDLLEQIAPSQVDAFDDMDALDFAAMFATWQSEYQSLNGASLGEASSSSD